jgi:glyoxylase I family protein
MQLVQTAPPVVAAPPLASLHHVGITVTDLDRSVAWYGEMLGMVQWMEETYPGGRTAGLMRPGTYVHLGLDAHDRNDGEDFAPHRTGLDHLCFGVASRAELDDWRAHLTARGVACSRDPRLHRAGPVLPVHLHRPGRRGAGADVPRGLTHPVR